METKKHDLIIIGAGPGGYVTAVRAAQLGLDTACVDKESLLGGTCLRVGCIPSKALLDSSEHYHALHGELAEHGITVGDISLDLAKMLKRKDKIVENLTKGVAFLFKKNKITRYEGTARFSGPNTLTVEGKDSLSLTAERIIIATGSSPASLPGVELDGAVIGSSTEALAYSEVPKRLVVIGAGFIGLELGSVWKRLGSDVTVVEYLDRVLPGIDGEIAKMAQRAFKRQGLTLKLGARVEAVRVEGNEAVVEIEGAEPIRADRVLMAVGRRPHTTGLDLDKVGIVLDPKGFIPVNEHYETVTRGIYAIGDVIGGAMLAHKASDEGVACIEQIVNGFGHINYDAIPGVVYTEPEIASVGKTEEELMTSDTPYKKGSFSFKANGRAMAMSKNDGLVKVLSHAETDRILGVHIIGPRAGDLIAEAGAAMEFGASSEDLARACHAHPTLSEALKEAALAVDGRAIHA